MSGGEPRNPDFERRVRDVFARQEFLKLIGAELLAVDPGYVEIALPKREDLTQQHGYIHGGVVATLADIAGGFAALSLMPAEANVLSVEFKLNLLAPAEGARLLARGEVVRAGRTLTVCQCDVYAETESGAESLAATALGTFIAKSG